MGVEAVETTAVAADTEGAEGETDTTSSGPAAVTRDPTISGGVAEAAAEGEDLAAGVTAVTGQ